MECCFNEATTLKNSTLEKDLECCGKIGFTWIELWLCQVNRYLEDHTKKELVRLFEDCGVRPFALDSFEDIFFRDADGAKKLEEEFLRACELGAEIGCDRAVVVPTVQSGVNDRFTRDDITQEALSVLGRLAELAEPFGMKLGLEPIGFADCCVRSIRRAWEIVERLDRPNVGLTLDVFNNYLYHGLRDMDDIKKIPGDRILIYHIDDAKAMPLSAYRHDHSDRTVPGSGDLPCVEMTRLVDRAGYRGPASVELFNRELYAMEPEEAIRRAYDGVKTILEQI